MTQRIVVSVVGARQVNAKQDKVAFQVGKIVVELGAVLVCGGLTGAMEASARGAKAAGGTTIGILPGTDKSDANPFIDIALPTSIGFARNVMVATSAHIIVALPGSYGTSSEIAYGLIYGRPVLDFGGWNVPGTIKIKDFQQLKSKLKSFIQDIKIKNA